MAETPDEIYSNYAKRDSSVIMIKVLGCLWISVAKFKVYSLQLRHTCVGIRNNEVDPCLQQISTR